MARLTFLVVFLSLVGGALNKIFPGEWTLAGTIGKVANAVQGACHKDVLSLCMRLWEAVGFVNISRSATIEARHLCLGNRCRGICREHRSCYFFETLRKGEIGVGPELRSG